MSKFDIYQFPHDPWPPAPTPEEENELILQRRTDISISGRTGPIAQFEDEFKSFLGNKVKHAITFNSGTSALQAAYYALGARRGVSVLGPALTYHAALSPAFSVGAEVILVDINQESRCIDIDAAEKMITESCRILTVVHQWGHPADMDKVIKFAEKHNLKILEDCSHAHGSKFRGRPVGTFGDAAVFSLQTKKAIFAGEGGILVTNDDLIADTVTLVGHYRDRARNEVKDRELQQYWVTGYGLKTRMSPFNAIVAKYSLRAFPQRMKFRHNWLHRLNNSLSLTDIFEPMSISPHADMGAWYGFKPLISRAAQKLIGRDHLVKIMQEKGLDVSAPSGEVLADQPLYSAPLHIWNHEPRLVQPIRELLPVAYDVSERAISFPTFYREEDEPLIASYEKTIAEIDLKYKRLLKI